MARLIRKLNVITRDDVCFPQRMISTPDVVKDTSKLNRETFRTNFTTAVHLGKILIRIFALQIYVLAHDLVVRIVFNAMMAFVKNEQVERRQAKESRLSAFL